MPRHSRSLRTALRTAIPAAACCLLVVAASACSVHGLVFHDNGTIKVTAPSNNAKVHLPVEVRWQQRAGTSAPAQWAVFVDRDPPAAGSALPGERSGIVVTGRTSLELNQLSPRSTGTKEERNQHSVVIVMLDDRGRRSSELSGFVQFEVRT